MEKPSRPDFGRFHNFVEIPFVCVAYHALLRGGRFGPSFRMKHPSLVLKVCPMGGTPALIQGPSPKIRGTPAGKTPAPGWTPFDRGSFCHFVGGGVLPRPRSHFWPGSCSSLVRNGAFTPDGKWNGKFRCTPAADWK